MIWGTAWESVFTKISQVMLVLLFTDKGFIIWPLQYFYSIIFASSSSILIPAMFYFQFPGRVRNNCWLSPRQYHLPETHCLLLCFTQWIVIYALGSAQYHFLQEGFWMPLSSLIGEISPSLIFGSPGPSPMPDTVWVVEQIHLELMNK